MALASALPARSSNLLHSCLAVPRCQGANTTARTQVARHPRLQRTAPADLCVHAYTYADMHAYIHAGMHAYIHAHMHAHLHARIHAYIQASIHVYIHARMHVYMRAYMHAHIHA